MIDENILHRTREGIKSTGGGITLQIEKKVESIHLPHYGCPIKHSKWIVRFCHVLGNAMHAGIPYSTVHGSDWSWKDEHFDYIIILCPTLQYNEAYR